MHAILDLPACLPACMPACMPACTPTCLPGFSPANRSTLKIPKRTRLKDYNKNWKTTMPARLPACPVFLERVAQHWKYQNEFGSRITVRIKETTMKRCVAAWPPACIHGCLPTSILACLFGCLSICPHAYLHACMSGSFNAAREVAKKFVHFSICACHPCAGAMLIFSVSFQF